MILTCPNCRTQYAVALSAIPVQGKRVRCTRCAHTWFTHRPAEENLERSPDIAPRQRIDDYMPKTSASIPGKGSYVTQMYDTTHVSAWLIAVCLGFWMIGGVLAALAFRDVVLPRVPALAKIEQELGLNPTTNYGFSAFEIQREREDNKLKFTLNATLVNHGEEAVHVRPVHMRILTQGGREMAAVDIESPKPVLEPGESVTLTPEIARVSGNAASLLFDIASPLEMLLR